MTYIVAYFGALAAFGVMDAIWLSIMGPLLYRPVLGDILLPDLRIAPAIAFYLMYPVGIVVFAIVPALRAETIVNAVLLGVLLGAIAYGTYDLTNHATLRNWTLQITALDMIYGALASATAAAAGYGSARAASGWFGS